MSVEFNQVVLIEQGSLAGSVRKSFDKGVSIYEFKGIPYAKPPIGDLRFAEPAPPSAWQGIRDATKDGNVSLQWEKSSKSFKGDEDCLYLNVYTPKLNEPWLPVMVYIHGGGFQNGSGADSTVNVPDFLVEQGVVLVSLNYRLGVLGFLSLDCKEVTGNMGLKDQLQALKWVSRNIKQFGGDPNNVTIFGESAGGASVQYLLMSNIAKRFFHKAIIQSGSTLNHWTFNDDVKSLAYKIPLQKGKKFSNDQQLLDYLKVLPKEELLIDSRAVVAPASDNGPLYFGFVPTIEKPKHINEWETIVDKHPHEQLFNLTKIDIPIMSGICSQEALMLIGNDSVLDKELNEQSMLENLPFKIKNEDATELGTKLKNAYSSKKDNLSSAIDFYSDTEIVAGVYVSAKVLAEHSTVYFYEFAYDGTLNHLKSKLNLTHPGACHADDVGYLIKPTMLTNNIPSSDALARSRMVAMWTNFAKYSNPTPEINETVNVKWTAFVEPSFSYLKIEEQLEILKDYEPRKMDLFYRLYDQSNR